MKRSTRWKVSPARAGMDPVGTLTKHNLGGFPRTRGDGPRRVTIVIKRSWPDLHYHTVTGALLLSPSPPRIPPAQLSLVE